MKELSVGEQRYQAVMAVLSGGRTVTEVARDGEVSRQTLHAWLARYEREGMEGMGDRSHRPTHCPHQMPALIEVRVPEMRRHKPFWGPRRLVLELARKGVTPTPSASAISLPAPGGRGSPSYDRRRSQEACRGAGPAALDLQRSVKDQPNQLRQASTEAAHPLQIFVRIRLRHDKTCSADALPRFG